MGHLLTPCPHVPVAHFSTLNGNPCHQLRLTPLSRLSNGLRTRPGAEAATTFTHRNKKRKKSKVETMSFAPSPRGFLFTRLVIQRRRRFPISTWGGEGQILTLPAVVSRRISWPCSNRGSCFSDRNNHLSPHYCRTRPNQGRHSFAQFWSKRCTLVSPTTPPPVTVHSSFQAIGANANQPSLS